MSLKHGKYLVTGGASFIGSHLVEALLVKGGQVRVADDLSSGKLSNLALVWPDIEFMEGDLKSIDFARKATSGCQAMFHLAADHGGRGYISTHPANCAGNMALDNIVFAAAVESGLEHITFASSACVYPTDIQDDKRLLTEDLVNFEERGGAFADEEYGWAKLMGELSLRAYHKQYGIGAAAGRISTAYGPRENESHAFVALIAKAFIQQSPFEIWGDGEQTRGFTYVTDVAEGLLLCSEHVSDGTAVNVGTDEFISLNHIASRIFKVMGWHPADGVRHLVDEPVGVMHRALDGTFAREKTGWTARTSLDEGLMATIKWYVENHCAEDVKETLRHKLNSR
jgi:nucleoside-diphosphate-sugar epimerase